MACPAGAFPYNGTLCFCAPGHYLAPSGSCVLFRAPLGGGFTSKSVAGDEPAFWTTILPIESIKRITQSQAVLLVVTAVALAAWLLFCAAIRLGSVDGGRTVWFKIRWWISRMDLCYDTQHWLDDGKVVMKRKTELGGAFSIASRILFIGLFSALLYQIITKRTIEVHRVKPSNIFDLLSFVNDMEFNITTISSMSCSHLRNLDTLVTGTPGSVDFRIFPLSSYANYSCLNTSRGPTITIKCSSCNVPPGNFYISWQFVDLPSSPASAVAFQFNLIANDHNNKKCVSYVSGTVSSGSFTDESPKTFRGPTSNVLKVHLFPQKYYNLRNLNIIQPLFHDFLPGSSLSETSKLRASFENSSDGLINTTLYTRFLSDYIVEIKNENILGLVSFLADLGGLYAFSIAVFSYLLWQCEYRIKKLRNEDSEFRQIARQIRAQRRWDKLRKYVMYTWGSSDLVSNQASSIAIGSFHGLGSRRNSRQRVKKDSISFDKTASTSIVMSAISDPTLAGREAHVLTCQKPGGSSSLAKCPKVLASESSNSKEGEIVEESHTFATGGFS